MWACWEVGGDAQQLVGCGHVGRWEVIFNDWWDVGMMGGDPQQLVRCGHVGR